MPKNKFQEVIFTIIMVFVMVYAMICYNIVLNTGTMTNETFLLAFHELTFMGPIAFILDFFIIGGLAKKIAFGIVLGIAFIISIPREAFQMGYWRQKIRLRKIRLRRNRKNRLQG